MKTLASAACVLLLLGAGASAQTLDDLKKDGNGGSTDNILTYGMGYHQQRYSPLKQINKQTVKRLVPVWNLSLDNNWGEQAQPIVYNGVMYVTNAKATVAIDVASGKQIWKQKINHPAQGYMVASATQLYVPSGEGNVTVYDRRNGACLGNAGGPRSACPRRCSPYCRFISRPQYESERCHAR